MSKGDVIELIGRLSKVGSVLKGDNDDQEYEQLIEWEKESGNGLDLIQSAGAIEGRARATQKAFLLNFRGSARIARYDIDGNHAAMVAALEDHRKAVDLAKEFDLDLQVEDYQRGLAKTLVRAGRTKRLR